MKNLLYAAGIAISLLAGGSAYSQDSTSISNRTISGNQVIENYDLKTEIKEVPLNMANLFSNPKDEIKNFSKYTAEDKEKCVKYMADFGISRNENYEKRIIKLEEAAKKVSGLEESVKTLDKKLKETKEKLKTCLAGEEPKEKSRSTPKKK